MDKFCDLAKRESLTKLSGVAIAVAAAGMFMTVNVGTATADEGANIVHCSGINGCRGTSSCKSANNSCKGQNACEGYGWSATGSEKECTDKGGKVIKE